MKNNIKLLDGSMSYPLELDGYNLNNRLWTGNALIDNPELIKKIHLGYINSGADYLLTSTYQISYDILREKGID
jgi:homocysteine S-methyltransferase